MNSPTTLNADGVPRRNKFKDSCDACAQAKVKCSRVRPSCQRCARNGVVCHYSLARRGKGAAAAILAASRNAEATSKPGAPASMTATAGVTAQTHGLGSQQGHSTRTGSTSTTSSGSMGDYITDDLSNSTDFTFVDDDFTFSAGFAGSPGFDTLGLDLGLNMPGMPDASGPFHDGDSSPESPRTQPPPGLDFSLLSRIGGRSPGEQDHRRSQSYPGSNTIDAHASAPTTIDPDLLNAPLARNNFNDGAIFGSPESYMTAPKTAPNPAAFQPATAHAASSLIPSGPQTPTTTNLHVILATLENLNTSSSTSTATGSGIDTILAANSAAVAKLASLLKRPRALDSPHGALLALICCNSVMDAYQQISFNQRRGTDSSRPGARGMSEDDKGPGSSGLGLDLGPGKDFICSASDTSTSISASSSSYAQSSPPSSYASQNDTEMGGMDVDVPIAVGAFLLDNRAKQKIISSLLLGELAKVGQIVDRIAPGGGGKVKGGDAGGESNGSREMVASVKALLKEKLRATVRTVKVETVDESDSDDQ